MKKILHLFLFLLCLPLWSQTAVPITEKIEKATITEDTSTIERVRFMTNFKDKYSDESFIYEKKAPVESLWERFKAWFAEWLKRTFDVQDSQNAITILDYIINTIAVLLILLVIYLIVKALLNKEGTWIFSSKSDRNLIRYDEIEKNLHLVDFEKLIKDSIKAGEHRLSIRYYYLFLLKKMSEKQIIDWDAEKTNSDYLYEIKSGELKARFEYLSYLYNYMWYGEFAVSIEDFEKAKKAFDTTLKSIY